MEVGAGYAAKDAMFTGILLPWFGIEASSAISAWLLLAKARCGGTRKLEFMGETAVKVVVTWGQL
jgi:hypothetical protein